MNAGRQPSWWEGHTDTPMLSSSWQKHGSEVSRRQTSHLPLSAHLWQSKSFVTVTLELCLLQRLHDYYSFAVAGFPIGFLHPSTSSNSLVAGPFT